MERAGSPNFHKGQPLLNCIQIEHNKCASIYRVCAATAQNYGNDLVGRNALPAHAGQSIVKINKWCFGWT
jgi:hypothetical protein